MRPQDMAQQVLAPASMAAIFLTLTVRSGAEAEVRDALGDITDRARSVSFRRPEDTPSIVTGIGATLWDRLYSAPRPPHLHPFRSVAGAAHTAPATAGDLFFHMRAGNMDACFDLCTQVMAVLDGLVDTVDETHAFRYWDRRDLLGFVDGTENPTPEPEAIRTALVGDEDPLYAGASYVIVQKYLHDMDAWNALTVTEQEKVIGRTKLEDVELSDDELPSNSHVALNTIVDEDGDERQIVRDNLPFGRPGHGEFGTYFIAYAADPGITELMLERMFIGEPVGNHDRILDFSTAITGCLFFVPPYQFLDDPDAFEEAALSAKPDTCGAPEGSADASDLPGTDDGSLGIGDMRRSGTP